MCLAVPAQILETTEKGAVVDLQGNRIEISTSLTPEAKPGDWVLLHAGFSLTILPEEEARETWAYLAEAGIAEAPPDG